jgi:hypothetical protein
MTLMFHKLSTLKLSTQIATPTTVNYIKKEEEEYVQKFDSDGLEVGSHG